MHNSNINKPRDLAEISHHRTMTHNLTTEQLVVIVTEAVRNALAQIPAQEQTPEVVSVSDAHSETESDPIELYLDACRTANRLPSLDSVPKTHPVHNKLKEILDKRRSLIDDLYSEPSPESLASVMDGSDERIAKIQARNSGDCIEQWWGKELEDLCQLEEEFFGNEYDENERPMNPLAYIKTQQIIDGKGQVFVM